MLLQILVSVERLRQVQQLEMEQQIFSKSLGLQASHSKMGYLQNHLIFKK
jgi:hypothetical protein